MKQILQSYRTGDIQLADVSVPALEPGVVLVQTAFSAVSIGTEGKKVATARQNLLDKARSRPDLVQQVIHAARTEGLAATYQKVVARLNEPVSLGYSAAGTVIAVGDRIKDFHIGDRVACGGEGAAHSEVMAVPVNLCVKVPDGVSLEHAAFTTIGSIALHGLRQADVTLGESVAVIGLGLVGQLALALAKANGCRVLGIDLDPAKVAMAERLGADRALVRDDSGLDAIVSAFSRGHGVDAVLIAAATSSNDPVDLAVRMCRDRGRIVAVGAVRLDVPRDASYYKEIEVKLSRSYGPGRYDSAYEQKGIDYPIGYVRWTERRNMEAFLDLLASARLDIAPLATHRFRFEEADQAYALITGDSHHGEPPLGIVFEYDIRKNHLAPDLQKLRAPASRPSPSPGHSAVGIGFIGAGGFARKTLLPPLQKNAHARLVGVATATGISGKHTADAYGFSYSTGDYRQILMDADVQAVFIATRHDQHAQLAAEALRAGKAVFVEKPLALTAEQLQDVVDAFDDARQRGDARLTVGFNRRFAPLVGQLRDLFKDRVEPMVLNYRINAGFVDGKHWVHDVDQGGGRVLGEVCHFIDLAAYLAGTPIRTVYAASMDDSGRYAGDNVSIVLSFGDGSIATIVYVANGDAALSKERLEVFCQGSTTVLDDFCRLDVYRNGRRQSWKKTQDKGHRAEVLAFVDAVYHGTGLPLPFADCVMSTLATLRAVEAVRKGTPLRVADEP